jgi:tetratricopeptide (TPR) repeat protein
MLRALSLFNEYPSTYDMAILKDLTTTTIKEKSIVYLHGQHHGLWLLNTEEEMQKVNTTVPRIFDSIKNKRPWIFIGYGGNDPVFKHIKNLGRFDNGLFWVTYNNHDPNEFVKEFLEKPNTNAMQIKGYDSDSFMIKLNNELGIDQPLIINKPFTCLRKMLENIVDVEDDEHFIGVNERLKISKEQVDVGINQFEEGIIASTEEIITRSKINLIKKEIINLRLKEEYPDDRIDKLNENIILLKDIELNNSLAELIFNKGCDLTEIARNKEGIESEKLYYIANEHFEKAIEIKPNYDKAFFNWAFNLGNLARLKNGKDAEILFLQAFEKYSMALKINPNDYEILDNWGIDLCCLADMKRGKEADELYKLAFEKYQKSIERKPESIIALSNWGTQLAILAKSTNGKEAESLYYQAFEKFQKAIHIKPQSLDVYNNWANFLRLSAEAKEGKEAESLFHKAITLLHKAIEYGSGSYNLSCTYASMGDKENALKYLSMSLRNNEIDTKFIENDEDWKEFLEDAKFRNLLASFNK